MVPPLGNVTAAVAVVVLMPMLIAAVGLLFGRRVEPTLPLLGSLTTAIAATWLAVYVNRHGAFRHSVGGWGAPLGIDLRLDGLAVVMLVLTAAVAAPVALYSASVSRTGYHLSPWFWPLFLFLWSGLNILFVTADAFNAYVALEMVSLAAVALVTLEGNAKALAAGMRYLLVALVGSLAYLLAIALLYMSTGTLDFALMAEGAQAGAAISLALALTTVGLFAKAAFFPLHAWLPPAHAAAPAPASALLSSLVVKGAFYLMIRLWFEVFSSAGLFHVERVLLGLCGATAVMWGSLLALRQVGLKALLAYSTVAQLGYLLLLFPLADSASAWLGTISQVAAHALAKAAMFGAAGLIVYAAGQDTLANIRGAAQALPMTVFAFGLGGLSLMGLPPSSGFVAKWLIVSAAFETGRWWWGLVPLAGGLLAGGYVFAVLARAFARGSGEIRFRPVPWQAEAAVLGLAIASLVLGFMITGPIAALLRTTEGIAWARSP